MRFTYRASVGAILSATGIASPTRIGEGSVGTIVRLTVVVVTVTGDVAAVAVTSSWKPMFWPARIPMIEPATMVTS